MITIENVTRSCLMIAILTTSAFSVSNIRVTKHNLSSNINKDTKSDDELCIYCHTPNGQKGGFSSLPAWNKTIGVQTFTIYSSINNESLDETPSANTSMACLSCHDGINAINIVANAPGAGGTISGAVNTIPTGSVLPPLNIGNENGMFLLSKGMNHPVSVTYNTGVAGLKVPGTPLIGWAGAKTIDSLLKNNKVECGSCHDPHEATNGTFLRISNSGGNLCIGCHTK